MTDNKKVKRKRIEKGIFLLGDTYYIQYYVNGKQVREAVGKVNEGVTKTMVRDVLTKRKADIRAGKIESEHDIKAPKRGNILKAVFDAFMVYSKNNKLSWKHDERSIKVLSNSFKNLQDLNHLQFERFKKQRLAEGVCYRTVDADLQTLNTAIKHGVKCNLLPDKFQNVKAKLFRKDNKKTDFLSVEEISQLLNACDPFDYMEVFVNVALLQGFRKSETLSLRWQDIDFNNERITILQTKTSKTPTTYILHHELKEYLLQLLREFKSNCFNVTNEIASFESQKALNQRDKKRLSMLRNEKGRFESEYVISRTGKRLNDVKKAWKTLLEKTGLKYRMHDLRHTYASQQLMNDMSLHDLVQSGLWKDYQSVLRYSHLEERNLKKKINGFSLKSKKKVVQLTAKKSKKTTILKKHRKSK